MNEDIKKAIRTVQVLHSGHLSVKDVHKGTFNLIIKCLRSQLNNGWTLTITKPPKQDEEVMVTDINGNVHLMWIVGDRFENLGNSVEMDFIVAWQPLPEPYKEDK